MYPDVRAELKIALPLLILKGGSWQGAIIRPAASVLLFFPITNSFISECHGSCGHVAAVDGPLHGVLAVYHHFRCRGCELHFSLMLHNITGMPQLVACQPVPQGIRNAPQL